MTHASPRIRQLPPQEFIAETDALLQRTQAQSRRLIIRAANSVERPGDFRLFAVYDGIEAVGALCYDLMTSYASVVGSLSASDAETILAILFEEPGGKFGGFHTLDGPPSAVQALSAVCTEAFGCVARAQDPLETMMLVSEPRRCVGIPGALKTVAPQSNLLHMLARWFEQFEKDINQNAYSSEGHRQVLLDLTATASRGGLFVWEVKEKPVAMAILGRTLPRQLLCVYTLPHMRGKGFAQALTSAVCAEHWQTTQGQEPLLLSAFNKFGAARVYERVGFESAGWLHTVTFEEDVHSSLPTRAAGVMGFASCDDAGACLAACSQPIACR